MADVKISQLPLFTGNTSGSFLVMNNSGETITYKVKVGDIVNSNSLFALTGSVWNTTNNLGITGSLVISGSITNRGKSNQVNNTAYGDNSLVSTLVGAQNNTAIGKDSLQSTTVGDNNTAVGAGSLRSNTSGSYNVAVGSFALVSNTLGIYNVAVGDQALQANKSGSYNVAVGRYALPSNAESFNTAVGNYSQFYNTIGNYQTSLGHYAGLHNTTGYSNNAIGANSLQSNRIGNENVAIGRGSQYQNESGSYNVAIGNTTLYYNESGSYNVAIGYGAGRYETNEGGFYLDNYGNYRLDLNASRNNALMYGQAAFTGSLQTLQINAGQVRMPLLTQGTGSFLVTYDTTGSLKYAPYSGISTNLFTQAEYYQTGTLTGATGVSGSVTYNASGSVNGITLNGGGTQITVSRGGVYNIQFSAQFDCSTGADTGYMWFKKNGTNIPDSASKVKMDNNTAQIMTVNILDNANANDYYQLVWQNSGGHARLLGEAASGNVPAIPSVITTITQVR